MAYLNPSLAASAKVTDLDLGPGWVMGEVKFGASPTVTTADVIDVFYNGTATGYFVADWFIAMEQVDTGAIPHKTADVSFTVNASNPGTVNWTGHGMTEGAMLTAAFVQGVLPSGFSLNTQYFVRNPTANSFNVSLTPTGSLIIFGGTPSGTARVTASYGVTFNVGVDNSSGTSISGTSGLRWATNVDTLGRTSGVSILRAPNGAHFLQNGHNNRIGIQVSNLPATAAWANKRIWMGLLLIRTGTMGTP